MQRAGVDTLNYELGLLMQYNPPRQSPEPAVAELCPRLTAPQNFYDRHLNANLSLKNVKVIPLATYISQAVNRTSQLLKDQKLSLPSHHPGDLFPSQAFRASHKSKAQIKDAQSLAEVYQDTCGLYSSVVASTFLLHPRAQGWFTTLDWGRVGPGNLGHLDEFSGNYALKILDGYKGGNKVQESIDQETRETLRRIQQNYRGLAFWEIFAISSDAEEVLKSMDGVASAECFSYDTCGTMGYLTPPDIVPATTDASMTGWGTPVSTFVAPLAPQRTPTLAPSSTKEVVTPNEGQPPRRRLRSHKPTITRQVGSNNPSKSRKGPVGLKTEASLTWPTVTPPVRVSTPTNASGIVKLVLQRAWARSVEHNTTYIVFYCGNFERIGFRHRFSQTLFLSDIIHVHECKNPGYGKIHVGLYLSILQDVIDRTEQQCKHDDMLESSNRKRRRGAVALHSNKRYRTRAMALRERGEADERRINHEVMKKEAANRSLALIELRYGIYNSQAPASFLRLHSTRKSIYASDEYLSIVLTSRIAAGVTGVAHGAHLKLLASDGNVVHLDVIVKLSFEPEQRERLRHEFSIYEHLASRGVVEGIPFIYGLFEDIETDAIALVMSNVGTALKTLLPNTPSYGLTISKAARDAYIRALDTIHAAGVRHHDIRPENLLLIGEDEVAIIDFDMAELNPSDGGKRREMRHMTDLLNGLYRPPNEFPSAATTPEKPVAVRPRTVLESLDEDEDEESE